VNLSDKRSCFATLCKLIKFNTLIAVAKVNTKLTLTSSFDQQPDFQDESSICADEIFENNYMTSGKSLMPEKSFISIYRLLAWQ